MRYAAPVATALLDPLQPVPRGLRVRVGADPMHRFAVHRNHVTVSLVDALANSFAVVQTLVGEAFFRTCAREFVRQCPPRTPVLARYGEAFPDFLATYGPAAGLDYLADVARLEYLRQAALYAADAQPLRAGDLQPLVADAERLAQHRWCLHPSVGVLMSRHPVVSMWAAHQHDHASQVRQALAALEWQPEAALVLRSADGWSVDVLPVSAAQAALVAALGRGAGLLQAAQAAQAIDPALDLPATLALLWQHGVWVDPASLQDGLACG